MMMVVLGSLVGVGKLIVGLMMVVGVGGIAVGVRMTVGLGVAGAGVPRGGFWCVGIGVGMGLVPAGMAKFRSYRNRYMP